MNKFKLVLVTLIMPFLFSCEDLFNTENGLTTEEVIEGLKTALIVGTDSSVAVTSALNGYYGDPLLKIPLPDEAHFITDNLDNSLLKAIGISGMVENVILSVNRAAETAATDAGPIFKDAITSLSISDAWDILNGVNPAASKKSSGFDSTAATAYLQSTTYDALVTAFSPKINSALDKKINPLTFSANDAWGTMTSAYNTVANSFAGQLANLTPVNTDMGEFAVGKALDGLFLKVGDEEVKIRRDPWAWASETVGKILTKVFGNKN